MSPDAPTTLHIPGQEPDVPAGAFVLGGAWLLVAFPLVCGLVWFLVLANRRRRVRPEEHAFFALCKRMRLRRGQVAAVRRYAERVARCEPIEVLMNEQMLAQAISEID